MPAGGGALATRTRQYGNDSQTRRQDGTMRSCARCTAARVRVRPGLSMVELLVVMIMLGIVITIAMPRLSLRTLRIEASTKALNTVLLASQRAAIQRQHNVVVAFDTVNQVIRVHEDANNDGVMDAGERLRQVPLDDGTRFGLGGAAARAIGGSAVTFTRSQGGWPAVTFSRAGTASEIGGMYISSRGTGAGALVADTRALEVERSTGRTERFMWNASTNAWIRVF